MYHVGKIIRLPMNGMSSSTPFVILSILGAGGFGSVWLARNLCSSSDIDSWISIKIMDDLDEYKEEVASVSFIKESFNPHIGHTQFDKRGYIFMRLLDVNLFDVAKYHRLEDNDILGLKNFLEPSLRRIHRKYKTIYGDFKPENVMLRLQNRRPKVQRIIDATESDLQNLQNTNATEEDYRNLLLAKLEPSDYDLSLYLSYNSSLESSESDESDKEESEKEEYDSEEYNSHDFDCYSEYSNNSHRTNDSSNSNVTDTTDITNGLNLDIADIYIEEISEAIERKSIYIVDYGACAKIGKKKINYEPTLYYRHPKIINGQCARKGTDLWALGCALFEIKTGKLLFKPFKTDGEYVASHLEMIKYFRAHLLSREYNAKKGKVPLTVETYQHLENAAAYIRQIHGGDYFEI